MRVFVTGASGFIGSAVVPELIGAGHEVVALARSESSAASLRATGVEVHRGSLEDVESLRAGAAKAEGVVHLGFIHDFSRFEHSVRVDLDAIQTLGAALQGSGGPLLVASGTLGVKPGKLATERDAPATGASPRFAAAQTALSFADKGVRSCILRFAPSVHGSGDHGFMARLVAIARETGISGYIGDGSNRWPGVHRLDAARLVRLALEKAPPGSTVHAIADEGISIRAIAEVIGRHLKLPTAAISAEQAGAHFGWLAHFLGWDSPASNELTRSLLDWHPTHPGLIDDLEAGHYFSGQQTAVFS